MAVHDKILLAARCAENDGEWRTAEVMFNQILASDPAHEESLIGIADALYYQGRLADAEIHYRTAVFTEPKNLNVRLLLARYYLRLEHDQAALDIIDYVLSHDPGNNGALLLVCDALRRLGRIDESYARAKELILRSGAQGKYYFYLAGILRQTLDWELWQELQSAANDNPGSAERRLRSRNLASFMADAEQDSGKKWLQTLARSTVKLPQRLFGDKTARQQPGNFKKTEYRIGFVCQELRDHPVGRYFLPLLRASAGGHMPGVKIYVYNTGDNLRNDPVCNEIQSIAGNRFRNVKNMPMDMVLETVRCDNIDVLFDLGGHSPRSATWMFEARLAPIQAMWLGWGHTVGSAGMDYLLADRYCAPSDTRYVDENFAIIDAPYMILPDVPVSVDAFVPPVLQNGFVTFGQPNRFDKWTPASLQRDAQIMRNVENSRLLVFHPDAKSRIARKNILSHFAAQNISSDRIDFIANTSSNYADCLRRIDMILDPIAVCGGATSLDALAHGVPVLTQSGTQMFQRFTESFLRYAGLDNFCARNTDDFISLATSIAGNHELLADYRAGGVARAVAASPLYDLAAYGAAWTAFVAKLSNRAPVISPAISQEKIRLLAI